MPFLLLKRLPYLTSLAAPEIRPSGLANSGSSAAKLSVVERAGRAHDERPGSRETAVGKEQILAVAPELQAGTVGRGHVGVAAQGLHEREALRFEPSPAR